MRLKSELYKKEQEEICDKIISILELDENNSFILRNLDNDTKKQQEILDLIPDIRKYFSFSTIIGASEPKKTKRPYMSIIRQICKIKYDVIPKNYMMRISKDKEVKTMKYLFYKKIH
jgi:hypothetical protein